MATNDPTFIYNQGRCYEQNGQYDLAATRFREYLRKAEHVPKKDRAAISSRVDDLERQSKEQSTTVPAPAPTIINLVQPAPAPSPPSQAGPGPIANHSPDRAADLFAPPSLPPPSAGSSPFYARWWFWTGVGTVVAGGVVTAVLLSHRSSKSPTCDQGVSCVP